MKKPLTWSEAKSYSDRLRLEGKRVVTTNGCFDLLHVGHVTYLEKARAFGDVLIVGINSDESVKRLKGPQRPLQTALDRAQILAALRAVDAVCVFTEDTPVEWLKMVKPDVHVKGGDYKPADMPETEALKAWGARVEIIPFVDGHSTSSLVAKASQKT